METFNIEDFFSLRLEKIYQLFNRKTCIFSQTMMKDHVSQFMNYSLEDYIFYPAEFPNKTEIFSRNM